MRKLRILFTGSSAIILLSILFLSSFTPTDNTPQKGLKDIYNDYFLIGAAINGWQLNGRDNKSMEVLYREFNSVTAENLMKPMFIQPREGEFRFDMADKFVTVAEEHDMYIVGHVLLWHSQAPRWFFTDSEGNDVSREVLLDRMENHITTIVGRYKGRVHCWDVVNEAVDDDGTMRKTKYLEIIGEDYVQKAFEYARNADPGAELIYNDYSLSNPRKRAGVIRLIKDLQSKGIKVDGIGMQAHYSLKDPSIDEFEESIKQFSALGVKVMITEMDISVLPDPYGYRGADISKNFELQEKLNPYKEYLPDSMQEKLAERYADFFRVMLNHSDVVSRVTFWGINDRQSWKNNFPVRGRTNYPLLFDRENEPKRAYFAVKELVMEDHQSQ